MKPYVFQSQLAPSLGIALQEVWYNIEMNKKVKKE